MVRGQWSVVSRTGPTRLPGRLLFPVLLALALFAHGCHTGDHDDEPAVAPPRAADVPEPEATR